MSGTNTSTNSASLNISSTGTGTALQTVLMTDEIVPGSDASYEVCKTIYLYHPLGLKMAESPITLAMSSPREISIPDSPEERVKVQFMREWHSLNADEHIANVMRIARIYGVSSLALGAEDVPFDAPLNFWELPNQRVFFSAFDPLNTAGSLVLNQDPNAPDFQKVMNISVNGKNYHRSRVVVTMNEKPIYIAYTGSAFGYVGRSVYQRALFPLKSFIQTMVTDDMVSRKAGVIVAKMKAPGSIVDRLMQAAASIKREMVKAARTENVLSITPDESIESLDLHNIDGAATMARKNILENIATAADMPAKLLNQETFAEGFADGTEDAKAVIRYIDRVRGDMRPLYAFMDKVVQHRAWNRGFYETIQRDFPEYADAPYEQAFYRWQTSFTATWPSLLSEPESEQVKVEETKFKAIKDLLDTFLPQCDPDNKALVLKWAADNFNATKHLFTSPLELDWDALAQYQPPQPGGEGEEGMPGAPGIPEEALPGAAEAPTNGPPGPQVPGTPTAPVKTPKPEGTETTNAGA
jgi:hypothetical protein